MWTVCTQATQAAHVAEEWVNQAFHDTKEEESKHLATQKAQAALDKKLKETFQKLVECDKARKSAEASVESIDRQAREQLVQLREVEKQLALAQTTITELRRELALKDKEMKKAKQMAYDQGQKETESHLKSQLFVVCRNFCLQTWVEALNATGVDPNSELRNLEKAFYPPAIRTRLALQSFVSTSTPALTRSTEVTHPNTGTTTPAKAKPTELQPKTTAPAKAIPSEQQPQSTMPAPVKLGEQQPSIPIHTKTKQTKLVVSKPNRTATHGTEEAAKAPPPADVPSTNAPPTSMVSSAPTPTLKVQATTETEAHKTSKARRLRQWNFTTFS